MTGNMLKLGVAVLFVGSLPCLAQSTSGNSGKSGGGMPPAGATALCKDGTYGTNPNKSVACRGHQGVKEWYQTVGGKTDPDIKEGGKGSTGNSQRNATGGSGNGQATQGNSMGNSGAPASNADMSGQRAQAINKKSGNAAVVTPNDTAPKTVPGPAVNGAAAANGNSGSSGQGNSTKGSSGSMANRPAAPGGGPGMVWVNSESKVYHCYGTEFYGKTKQGSYVSEQQAKQMGARPDHGKSCSAGNSK